MNTARTLAVVDGAHPFFDVARLQDLVGASVTATGLRHKPGVSTTATLLRPDGVPWGWAQLLNGSQADKVTNARRRALARGESITVRTLGPHAFGGRPSRFLCGRISSDPRLHRALDGASVLLNRGAPGTRAGALDAALTAGEVVALRYNALRRLVLRGGEGSGIGPGRVLRLTAAYQQLDPWAVRALSGLGVPIVTPLEDPTLTSRRVTLWPWVPGVDLAAAPDADAAMRAGAALARLHDITSLSLGPRIAGRLRLGEDPFQSAQRVLDLAMVIAPALQPRLLSLLSLLPPLESPPSAIVHGDFSADQVVHAGADVHLLDLDRLHLGDPHADLGGFAAVELRRTGHWGMTGALLQGYAGFRESLTGAEEPISLTAVSAWTAHALVLRLLEPFRAASPTWLEEMERRVEEIETVLADGVTP